MVTRCLLLLAFCVAGPSYAFIAPLHIQAGQFRSGDWRVRITKLLTRPQVFEFNVSRAEKEERTFYLNAETYHVGFSLERMDFRLIQIVLLGDQVQLQYERGGRFSRTSAQLELVLDEESGKLDYLELEEDATWVVWPLKTRQFAAHCAGFLSEGA